MSIALLVQVYEEVRRLAIAGGAVAAGDYRLKKLVPPLEQAGAKAPVFAKVAQGAQAVVDSDEKTASAALLELATLVNAVLYTQGETGVAGQLEPIATTDLGVSRTQVSARVLKPLLEALTSTGSGRLELVRDAVDRDVFKDLRLVKAALNALDDPYPEIAALIAEKVLPLYDKAIVAELRSKLDLKGRGGNLHRLRLMHRLDPEGSRDIVRQALDEGSNEIRLAAIECLDTTGDDLTYLLEQTKAKAKDVRGAALGALCSAGPSAGGAAADAVNKAIDGADLELILGHLRHSRLPAIQAHVLARAIQQFEKALALKDAKTQGLAIDRLRQLTMCLEGRTDAQAEAFLLRCFEARAKFAAMTSATPSGQDFNELLAWVMMRSTPKTRATLVAAHATLSGGMLPPMLAAARETMKPAAFFDEFSPLLKELGRKRTITLKRGSPERGMALIAALTAPPPRLAHSLSGSSAQLNEERDNPVELDPRWLDAAIDARAFELVCALARPGHAKLNQFLSEQLSGRKPHEEFVVLQTMVRVGHPGAADAIIDQLKKHAKTAMHTSFGYLYARMIAELPRSALPKFEAVLPELPDTMVKYLMHPVMVLRDKPTGE